eukprot:858245-Amphidinium_carterae.4
MIECILPLRMDGLERLVVYNTAGFLCTTPAGFLEDALYILAVTFLGWNEEGWLLHDFFLHRLEAGFFTMCFFTGVMMEGNKRMTGSLSLGLELAASCYEISRVTWLCAAVENYIMT